MALFDSYLPVLLSREGGFVDHPLDSGGPTNMGVTLRTFRLYRGSSVGVEELRSLSVSEAGEIYRKLYWDKMRLDEVNSQRLAMELCDHGVNAGVLRSAKMVQYLLNTQFGGDLVVDGIIGSKTLLAINSANEPLLFSSFQQMRTSYYRHRAGEGAGSLSLERFFIEELKVSANSSQKVFLKGWLARVRALSRPQNTGIFLGGCLIGLLIYFFRVKK